MNSTMFVPIFLELLGKSLLILSVATVVDLWWHRASAAERHLVWLAALGSLLLLPLTRSLEPRWAVPLQRATVELPQQPLPKEATVEIIRASNSAEAPEPVIPRWRWPDWKHSVLWIWAIGAGLLLGARFIGVLRLARLRKLTTSLNDPRALRLAEKILREFGIRRRVELRAAPEGFVPLTWGTLRPVLALPREALTWSDGALEAVLRHEAGHIARCDHLVRWLGQIVRAFYWPNPLVWLALRKLRAAQEEATDDLVLRAGTAPEEYAAQLFEVARMLASRHRLAGHAVAMASPSTLERRMLAIVDSHRDRRPIDLWTKISGALAVVLVLGVATAAQLRAQEKVVAETAATSNPPTQIQVEAKFVELTAEAMAKLTESLGTSYTPNDLPGAAQGAVTFAGVWTEAQFDKVTRALQQQKGVDVLSAPRVTTPSGQKALVEIVREFRYAREFKKDGLNWEPKEFENRKVGVTFELKASLGADGHTLDLELAPRVVKFLGWVDLETGQKLPVGDQRLVSEQGPALLTGIPVGHRGQPIFSDRKITTSVSVFDGQTILLAQTGDEPENSGFPRSQPARRLMIFVTAKTVTRQPPAPDASTPASATPVNPPESVAAKTSAEKRAAAIIIPVLQFREMPLNECIAVLQQEGIKHLDAGRSVELIFRPLSGEQPLISVSLTNVPFLEAARYLAGLSNLTLSTEADSLVIGPPISTTAPAPTTGDALINAPQSPKEATKAAKEMTARTTTPVEGSRVAGAVLLLQPIRIEKKIAADLTRRVSLRIPLKKRPEVDLEVSKLVVHLLFYDLVDGKKVVPTVAKITSSWMAPPVDWAENGTEELSLEYKLPRRTVDKGEFEDRDYHGYTLRVYYQDELQIAAAEPQTLLQQVPH